MGIPGIAELKASNFRTLRRFKISPGEQFQRIIRVTEGKRKKRMDELQEERVEKRRS